MTPAEWIAAGQLSVSALAVGSIWFGIWQMRRAGDQRSEREDQRHTEAMRALEAMVAGLERQGQALETMVAGLERQGQALERQGQALERQGRALEAALTR